MRKPVDDPYGFELPVPAPRVVVAQTRQRTGSFHLYVDLVPTSAWFSNLRAELSPGEWKSCAAFVAKRAGYCCEICEGRGPKWPVECHERWAFDEATGVQKLVALEALCPDCHEATHIGLAQARGHYERAAGHLMRVNGWSEDEVKSHLREAVTVFRRRSDRPWQLDASHLMQLPILLSDKSKSLIERHASAAKILPRTSTRDQLIEQTLGR